MLLAALQVAMLGTGALASRATGTTVTFLISSISSNIDTITLMV